MKVRWKIPSNDGHIAKRVAFFCLAMGLFVFSSIEGRAECNSGPPFEVIEMLGTYDGEETTGSGLGNKQLRTIYFSSKERKLFKVKIGSSGVIKDASGSSLSVDDALYVMSSSGSIYVVNKSIAKGAGIRVGRRRQKGQSLKKALVYVLHHSSFYAGEPVAAAGHISIRDGELVELNNNSGHYRPRTKHLCQVVNQLKSQGVKTKGVVDNIDDADYSDNYSDYYNKYYSDEGDWSDG